MNKKVPLHQFIANRRAGMKLTIRDLAALTGVCTAALKKIEAGETLPRQQTLLALCYGLDLDPKVLLCEHVELNDALRKRYKPLIVIEYSGDFELVVTCKVRGENRAEIVRRVKAALADAAAIFTRTPPDRELMSKITREIVHRNGKTRAS